MEAVKIGKEVFKAGKLVHQAASASKDGNDVISSERAALLVNENADPIELAMAETAHRKKKISLIWSLVACLVLTGAAVGTGVMFFQGEAGRSETESVAWMVSWICAMVFCVFCTLMPLSCLTLIGDRLKKGLRSHRVTKGEYLLRLDVPDKSWDEWALVEWGAWGRRAKSNTYALLGITVVGVIVIPLLVYLKITVLSGEVVPIEYYGYILGGFVGLMLLLLLICHVFIWRRRVFFLATNNRIVYMFDDCIFCAGHYQHWPIKPSDTRWLYSIGLVDSTHKDAEENSKILTVTVCVKGKNVKKFINTFPIEMEKLEPLKELILKIESTSARKVCN